MNIFFSIKESGGPQNTFDLSKYMHKYERISMISKLMVVGYQDTKV